MVSICGIISDVSTLPDLLVWPTSCNYYFYLYVVYAIFGIIAFSTFFYEKERFQKGDIISSLGVAAIPTFVLGLVFTLVKNSAGIPMLQMDLFIYVLATSITFIVIWMFKK